MPRAINMILLAGAAVVAVLFLVSGNYIGAAVVGTFVAILIGLKASVLPAVWFNASPTGNTVAVVMLVVIGLTISAVWWVVAHGAQQAVQGDGHASGVPAP